MVDSRELEIDLAAQAPAPEYDNDPESVLSIQSGISLHDLAIDLTHDRAQPKRLIRLANPDPIRFLQGELRSLWQEAVEALSAPGQKKGHRHVPVGPYRLTVVPSVREPVGGPARDPGDAQQADRDPHPAVPFTEPGQQADHGRLGLPG